MSDTSAASFIDFKRNKRVTTKLTTKDNEEVNFTEVLKQINGFIDKQFASENANSTTYQIFPLIAHALDESFSDILSDEYIAQVVLSQPGVRKGVILEMLLSFYLLKFIQKNELKIVTSEEDVSQEECDRAQSINKANSVFALAALLGIDTAVMAQIMLSAGAITKEDLVNAGLPEEEIAAMLEDVNEDSDNS